MNPRSLLRSFVRGGPCERSFVAPFAFYHAARIEGDSFEALFHDPTRLTRALLDQRRLLRSDAVTVRFDEAIIGAAGGLTVDWSSPMPRLDADEADRDAMWSRGVGLADGLDCLFDVVGRLAAELRREIPVLAVISGPRALKSGAAGAAPEIPAVLREIVDRSCKAGAEALAVEESLDRWDEAAVRAELAPILNTARYYNAATFLTAPHVPGAKLADAVILPSDASPPPKGLRIGTTVPAACFVDEEALDRFTAAVEARGEPMFITADDGILLSQTIERNVAVFERLNAVAS